MKSKSTFIVLLSALFLSLTASAEWTQRASFPGVARSRSVAFTIDNKIYVMGGYASTGAVMKDFWEYDIATDTWLQKTDFPGPERYAAVSFVINGNGYIATGANDFGFLDDLWEYNPPADHWTQNIGLPATQPQRENQRREAFVFTIGNKAYLGGGEGFVFGGNSTTNIAFADLWEYDSAFNTWTQKSDIPDFLGRNMSIAVAFNGKGYVGLGCDVLQTTGRKSIWEYDPSDDSWTAKSDIPSVYTTDAGAFVLDSDLYVVGGVKFNPVGLSGQVYKYHIPSDSWTPVANFDGAAIAGEFAVSTDTSAFVGTGFTGSLATRSDLWQFTTGSNTTGIDENNFQTNHGVGVYPNPASTFISVSSEETISLTEVYDISGNKLLSQEGAFNLINVQKLLAGVYDVRVTMRDGCVMHRRFVKMD